MSIALPRNKHRGRSTAPESESDAGQLRSWLLVANDRVLHESVELACLPRKGAPKEEEQTSTFIQARHHHAGVESKIGALQSGNGQSRCRDQGEVGYARYIMLGALARNLQTLGRLLLAGSSRSRAA